MIHIIQNNKKNQSLINYNTDFLYVLIFIKILDQFFYLDILYSMILFKILHI